MRHPQKTNSSNSNRIRVIFVREPIIGHIMSKTYPRRESTEGNGQNNPTRALQGYHRERWTHASRMMDYSTYSTTESVQDCFPLWLLVYAGRDALAW